MPCQYESDEQKWRRLVDELNQTIKDLRLSLDVHANLLCAQLMVLDRLEKSQNLTLMTYDARAWLLSHKQSDERRIKMEQYNKLKAELGL